MKKYFNRLKDSIKKWGLDDDFDEGGEEEYLELDTSKTREKSSKILVRPFTIEDFSDVKVIIDSLRDGYTIALVNIKPIKDKDLVELKRAINKLKKTTDAINGDIAGFGDDYIVVTPSFAEIYRSEPEKD